jgi:hypothetical protein
VAAIPANAALDPLRARLGLIETQFAESGRLLNTAGSLSDPKALLGVQVQLYQMMSNVEMLSKVVDQMTSGVKTILQTQV